MSNQFIKTLFDSNEMICLADNVFGTGLFSQEMCQDRKLPAYFAINPLHTSRRDANVTAYRNILLEFDNLKPTAQMEVIHKIPHSTVVWSGGKSYHAIISLQTPMPSRAHYDALVARIHAAVPDADPTAKNPSRLSRMANSTRDNGKLQQLVYCGERISSETINAWLGQEKEVPARPPVLYYDKLIPMMAKHYLAFGSVPGRRNSDLYKCACDLAKAGFSIEETFDMVEPIADLPLHEIGATIKSAYSKVSSR
jgi:hypothetical protein